MDQPPPPPGWYPDPQPDPNQHGHTERYWDGAAWTGHTRASGLGHHPGPGAWPYGDAGYGTPGGGGPYGGAQYGAPQYQPQHQQAPYASGYVDPRYGARPHRGENTLSIIGIVCGAVAFVFCPILLGPAGIVLGAIGRSKGESLSTVAIVVGIAGLVIGTIVSILAFSAMYT